MSAAAGSILEAVRDPEADVVGNRITLTANSATVNPASTIGTTTDALEVNSAVSAAGIVRAISRGSLFLSETAGGMTLAEARSATGNIRIDVPDSGTTGRDLIMFMPIAASASLRLTSGEVLGAQLGQSKEETTRDVPVFAKAFVLDTNGDGSISPLDVLTIINYINEKRGGQRAEEAGEESQFNDFLDANIDGMVSPLDVLTLINYLNLRSNGGEGESAPPTSNSVSLKLPSLSVSEEELLRTKKRLGR